ncbi:metallophosphoesterase [Pirellulaceae bacterium SH449]
MTSEKKSGLVRMFSRRRFLLGGAAMSLLGWTYFVEPRWLEVTKSELLIPNLPDGWTGKRLVHITDLHSGKVTTSYLQRAIRVINELDADLHVFTGDFIDHTAGIEELKEVLSSYRPARNGAFACLGNHDYGLGWRQTDVADRVADVVTQHDIKVLNNSSEERNGLHFVGLEDRWSPRFRASEVLRDWDPLRPSICLCHNPDVCDANVWGDFTGIILAGHTHGGQCKPPFLPPPLLPVENRRYTSGLFKLDARRSLFISRGVGHTARVRFNCRPEIAVFTMKRA